MWISKIVKFEQQYFEKKTPCVQETATTKNNNRNNNKKNNNNYKNAYRKQNQQAKTRFFTLQIFLN